MFQTCFLCDGTITLESDGRRMTEKQKPEIAEASAARGLKIHETSNFKGKKILFYHNTCSSSFKILSRNWIPPLRQAKPNEALSSGTSDVGEDTLNFEKVNSSQLIHETDQDVSNHLHPGNFSEANQSCVEDGQVQDFDMQDQSADNFAKHAAFHVDCIKENQALKPTDDQWNGGPFTFTVEANHENPTACKETANFNQPMTIDEDFDLTHSQLAQRSTRSSVPVCNFNYSDNCLLCGEDASDSFIGSRCRSKKISKRQNLVTLITANDQPILQRFKEFFFYSNDKSERTIYQRIVNEYDLCGKRARFHNQCRLKYMYPKKKSKGIYPKNEDVVQFVRNYLLSKRDTNRVSLTSILSTYNKDFSISYEQIARRVQESEMWVSLSTDRNDFFFDVKCEKEIQRRLILDVGKIIFNDIKKQEYSMDSYPPPSSFLSEIESQIPDSLSLLLSSIVGYTKRNKGRDRWGEKITAICHAIISAARPRSFVSPLLLGLGILLYKKLGSPDAIKILAAFGFSISYSEILLFESSCISSNFFELYQNPHIPSNSSIQQVIADNADHNPSDNYGLNALHIMGVMQALCPDPGPQFNQRIPRVKKILRSDVTIEEHKVGVLDFPGGAEGGIGEIEFADLELLSEVDIDMTPGYFLWVYKKIVHDPEKTAGWNAFMVYLTKNLTNYFTSKLLCLPFIQAPASDTNTVYTTLIEAINRSEKATQNFTIITFDLPLYLKAKDIVECMKCCGDPDLANKFSKVFVRLGGFHLIMSFMGAIGFIMADSGLKECLNEVYAWNSLDKMMSGHAYSRALRGHTLAHAALARIVFNELELDEKEKQAMVDFSDPINVINISIIQDVQLTDIHVASALKKFRVKLNDFKSKSRTSKLWVEYFHMVTLLKLFIESERTGNWSMQIDTLKKMIPIFHASGHFHYAKALHLYLQEDVKELLGDHAFNKFANDGYFTIRRVDRFFSGIWSDMTIEQFLMRSFKLPEGLTRGRGCTDHLLIKFIVAMPFLVDIIDGIRKFSNVKFANSEDNGPIDGEKSRIKADFKDMTKIHKWFEDHPPFLPPVCDAADVVISIASGHKGDLTVNCHEAFEKGLESYKKMIGKTYAVYQYSKSDRVTTLAAMANCKKIGETKAMKNPLAFFQRMCLISKSQEELALYISFELAPVPLSIFDANGMRKSEKSKLYALFKAYEFVPANDGKFVVVDGGFLLHKVVWNSKETFKDIVCRYVNFVISRYGYACAVIFDGYGSCTKDMERSLRRKKAYVPDINVKIDNICKVTQQMFLSNTHNKQQLIDILREEFLNRNIDCKVANGDADIVIVETAISYSEIENEAVVIVGEDIDLLIILTQLSYLRNIKKPIHFQKPTKKVKGGKIIPQRDYDQFSFINKNLLRYITFFHAFGGCDTTSSFYRHGKHKFFDERFLEASTSENYSIAEFYKNDNVVDRDKLIKTGTVIIQNLYAPKLKDEIDLGKLRYLCLVRRSEKSAVELECLPPTEDAVKYHIFRVYFQVQLWMGNGNIRPENWGLQNAHSSLIPIMTDKAAAPPELLKIVSCACLKGCNSNRCSCRKASLKCSIFCKTCEGTYCSNCEEPQISVLHDEPDDPDTEACKDYREYLLSDIDGDDVNHFDDKCDCSNSPDIKNGNEEGCDIDVDDNSCRELDYREDDNKQFKDLSYAQIVDTSVRPERDVLLNLDWPDAD